jgi:hypothetical protein
MSLALLEQSLRGPCHDRSGGPHPAASYRVPRESPRLRNRLSRGPRTPVRSDGVVPSLRTAR